MTGEYQHPEARTFAFCQHLPGYGDGPRQRPPGRDAPDGLPPGGERSLVAVMGTDKRRDRHRRRMSLRCRTCGSLRPCSDDEILAFLRAGFPECCAETMFLIIEKPRP